MFLRISFLLLLSSLLAACGASSDTADENQPYSSRTFSLSLNELTCIQFTAYSQRDQDQIQSLGGVDETCSQAESLGSCQQSATEYGYTFNTIYYKNATNSNTVQSLRNACEQAQGSFTFTDPDANTGGSSENVIERTYITQQNSIACTEQTSATLLGQNQIVSVGGVEGSCSLEGYLGVCQQAAGGELSAINTVYYADEAGLRTAESLVSGCEHIGGSFIFADPATNTGPTEPEVIVERTYIVQQDTIACTEYTSSTLAGQNQITNIGGIEGSCSRSMSLGTCQRFPAGEINTINKVYYPDEAGLRTAESLVPGCEHIAGVFIYADNTTPPDTSAPILSEVTAIGTVSTYTPSYSFISSKAGTITYLGACSSNTSSAMEGTNTVTFNTLAAGFYDNCRILVHDNAGNISAELILSAFTINDSTGPSLSNISTIGRSYINNPTLTFISDEAGMLGWAGSCSSGELNFLSGLNHIELAPLNAGTYDDCFITAYDVQGNPAEAISLATFTIVILDADGDGFSDFVEAEYGTDANDKNSTPVAELENPVDFSDDNDSDGFSDAIEIWLDSNPNNIAQSPIDENGDSVPDGFDPNTDTLAPRILAFDMPDNLVIDAGNESVAFNLTLADNLSGVARVSITLRHSTWQTVSVTAYGAAFGNKIHALSLDSSKFNQFSAAGKWELYDVSVEDISGNYKTYYLDELKALGLQTSIQIENIKSDIVQPSLTDFSIIEDSITILSGQETVSFNLTVTDSLSGFGRADIVLKNAAGNTVYISEYESLLGQSSATLTLTSSEFGLDAEAGSWTIDAVNIEDSAGNFKRYTAMDLNQLMFENSVLVSKP